MSKTKIIHITQTHIIIMSLFEITAASNVTTIFFLTSTTHLPPLSHVSILVGYISLCVCVLFWGTFFLPVKHYGNVIVLSEFSSDNWNHFFSIFRLGRWDFLSTCHVHIHLDHRRGNTCHKRVSEIAFGRCLDRRKVLTLFKEAYFVAQIFLKY